MPGRHTHITYSTYFGTDIDLTLIRFLVIGGRETRVWFLNICLSAGITKLTNVSVSVSNHEE